jgi:hypothetical protein
MDPKPVKMTIRCGICHINTKNTKHMYSITEALKQENPRIHSEYTEGYLKIHELFSRQRVFINRVELVFKYCFTKEFTLWNLEFVIFLIP